MGSIGEQLAAAREAGGKSVQDVERAIKIRAKYIEALEADNFDKIPGDAYVAGFVKTYCEFLKIDPAPLLEIYRAEHETPKLTMPQPVMSATREHPRIPRLFWVVVLAIAGLAFAGWVAMGLFSALKPSTPVPEPTTTPVVAEPTATPKPKPKAVANSKKRRAKRPVAFTLKVSAIDGPNWISARIDGKKMYDGAVPAGTEQGWVVRKRAVLRTTYPNFFNVYRNGRLVGLFGPENLRGKLVTRTFPAKMR